MPRDNEVIVIDDDDLLLNSQRSSSPFLLNTEGFCLPSQGTSKQVQDQLVPELSRLEKWTLCAMWRNKRPLTEIAQSLGKKETSLHNFIYELIRKEALCNEPPEGR
jgi:hypothetical protein